MIANPVLSRSLALEMVTLEQSLVGVGLLRLGRSYMDRTTSEAVEEDDNEMERGQIRTFGLPLITVER